MKFLDLFCCCGGISQGLKQAIPDAEITGVDIKDGHDYPFNFIKADVFDLPVSFFEQFDLIHASPPCQAYSIMRKRYSKKQEEMYEYPDLVDKTRQLLLKTGKPFTMENVMGSPLRNDLILCGEMFGLKVLRHRIFEVHGFTAFQPPHIKHKLSVNDGTAFGVYGQHGRFIKSKELRKLSYQSLENWKNAMGIEWVLDRQHLTQMIPPKYYEYIAQQFKMCLVYAD